MARHNKDFGAAITRKEISKRLKEQDNRCAATGLPLDFDHNGAYASPYSPSLDRLDNSQANYAPENVQIVCLAYNVSRNRFPRAALAFLAQAMTWGPTWTQLAMPKTG